MSGSGDLDLLLTLLPFLAVYIGWSIFTTLRAFKIRNSVLVPTHRYQALWVAASAIYWIVAGGLYLLVPFLFVLFPQQVLAAKTPLAVTTVATLWFGVAFTLAWADAVVPIARNSDPRNRDIFRWSYSRIAVWSVLAIEIIIGSLFIFPSIIKGSGTGALGPVGLGVVFYANIAPYFVLIGIIIVATLIKSYLQTGDAPLRTHLKWLISYVVVLSLQGSFVFIERSNLSTLTQSALPGLMVLATLFGVILTFDYVETLCLYKCMMSLVPISRFPPTEKVESKF